MDINLLRYTREEFIHGVMPFNHKADVYNQGRRKIDNSGGKYVYIHVHKPYKQRITKEIIDAEEE